MSLERYSPEAKSVVASAQLLADERKHAEVGPLHLLARLAEPEPGAALVFQRAGLRMGELQAAIERALAALPRSSEAAFLSAAMLDLLERAEREAQREREPLVRIEHLLNALTQEIRGAAGEILGAFGISPGALRTHMAPLRRGSATVAPAGSTSAVPYTRDLLALVRAGQAEPVVGRDAELKRVLTILERRNKHHPLLIGEPGVGKAAIVRALALALVAGSVPARLVGARLLELDAGGLLSGARLRGEIEERVRKLVQTLADDDVESILVARSVDQLFTNALSGYGVGELLRPALERGQLRLLATTTPEGVRRMDEKDPDVVRLFTTIAVAEPDIETAIEIVRNAAFGYEKHHGVKVLESSAVAAVRLAKRYVQERFLPDSALDLLDEAAAKKRVDSGEATAPTLNEHDVAATVALWTGIPVSRMLEGEAEKLLKMEERLGARVIGQDEAVAAVARAVRRGRVGLRDAKRPIGSFLFLGPSGVGKTELAKALAQFLFDDKQALTRLDMSEFMERHMAQRLLGAPPGYADSERGGFLTEAVRHRPYSVLLFDEVEKAHQDVFNLLLQVLDDGRLTDGRGRLADFSNTVVIMTSNIGSERILQTDPKVFATPDGVEAVRDVLLDQLRTFFRPEFLNRVDEIVVFGPLDRDELRRIVDIQLDELRELLVDRQIQLELDEQAKARLVELGYEPGLGARPLKRAILKYIQDPLAEALLAGQHAPGSTVSVSLVDGQFVFTQRSP
jgi:ATP-dependent Clp protease ATP-binding subunit ClpC